MHFTCVFDSSPRYLYQHNPKFAAVLVKVQGGVLTVERKDHPTLALPLLLCTVKEVYDSKVRFVFEIISAGQEPVSLQADDRKSMNEWVAVGSHTHKLTDKFFSVAANRKLHARHPSPPPPACCAICC